MASTYSKGLAALGVTVTAMAAAFGLCPSAAADPGANPGGPNPTQELPGLPALAQLSPIIQQAASNPQQATQLLMAAAQAFAHTPSAPTESRNVATSVNQFVANPANPPEAVVAPDSGLQGPVPHVPPPGVVPGTQSHLPTGIDPVHAAGPASRGADARPGTHKRASRGPRCGNGHSAGTRPGARSGGGPGFRSRRPADAGLHVSLDRDELSCGRQ